MTAQVYIILAEAKNVLTVPAAALQSSNRGKRGNRSADVNTKNQNTATNAPASTANRGDGENNPNRPARLNLTDEEKSLVAQAQIVDSDGSCPTSGWNSQTTICPHWLK